MNFVPGVLYTVTTAVVIAKQHRKRYCSSTHDFSIGYATLEYWLVPGVFCIVQAGLRSEKKTPARLSVPQSSSGVTREGK